MDYSLPGSSVHGIFQARVLEWVAISFSRVIFPTQGSNLGLPHCRQTLYCLSHQRSPTLQYSSGFCHTLTWISHGCTCVPCPEPPSYLPPHPISQGHPSAPALSTLSHASNLTGNLFHIWYYTCFNAILSNHPTLTFSQSPKVCSLYLCLFCCLAHRVIIIIFLNSTYMR